MRLNKIAYSLLCIFKDNFRNRITILLLLIIPATFYIIAIYTTTEIPMLIRIASAPNEPVILIKPKNLGLIYIGLAATGFIASFMALNIMQRNTLARKRLVLCGYKPFELGISKFFLVLSIVIVVGIYTAAMGLLLLEPKHIFGVIAGYILCGFVYGSYGLFIGAILKRELEGILLVVLLANLDIGWLQNPIFYAGSQNKLIIKLLPGFNPAQVSVISAFTDYSVYSPVIYSLLYGSVFLILSMIIFGLQMRVNKNNGQESH
jgi:ABC-2 type transport system permease protein